MPSSPPTSPGPEPGRSARPRRQPSWLVGACLAWAAIAALTLTPGSSLPSAGLPGVDKLAHFALWAVGALALRFALRRGRGWPARRAAVVAFGVAVGLGVAVEAAQALVPGRSPEALDVVADALGASVTLWFMRR